LFLNGQTTTEALMRAATCASKDELAQLLAGTPAQGLFDQEAGRALASTRFVLTAHLNPHKYVAPGDFSLQEWVNTCDRRMLFLTWRADMQTALMPLVSC